MKGVVDGTRLASALDLLRGVPGRQSSLPIVGCILLHMKVDGTLELSATNFEQSMRVSIPANTQDPGQVAVNAHTLVAIAHEAKGETVMLTTNANHQLTVKGGGTWRVAGLDAQDFPLATEQDAAVSIPVSPALLAVALKRIEYAIAKDESRHSLNGVRFRFDPAHDGESARLVLSATDGHRLVEIPIPSDGPMPANASIIVPRTGVIQLAALLKDAETAALEVDGRQLVVKVGDVTYSTRLIEGQFPNTTEVIKSAAANPLLVTLDVKAMMLAIRKVALIVDDKTRRVKLAFETDKLTVSARSAEMGDAEVEVPLTWPHAPLEIAFNGGYLMQCFAAAASQVTARFKEGMSPMHVFGDGSPTSVVMPMRL
jgi:DNA polymerase-3 subunit beta